MVTDDVDNKNIALLILSFDGAEYLWKYVDQNLTTFWPDCPYDKFLLTNFKDFQSNHIENIKVGNDISWSSNLIKALDALVNYEMVLIFLDDCFLLKNVDQAELDRLIGCFKDLDGEYLSLKSNKDFKVLENGLGEISLSSPYRVTPAFGLFKRLFLLESLKVEENAWKFERNSSNRTEISGTKLHCTQEEFFTYLHAIVKGKWSKKGKNQFESLNMGSLPKEAELFSMKEIILMRIYEMARKVILIITPKNLRKFYVRRGLANLRE